MFKKFQKIKKDLNRYENEFDRTEIPAPVRAILSGRLYDTSKATCICYGEVTDNLISKYELPEYLVNTQMRLYKTEKGNFFIRVGRRIIPISEWDTQILLSYKPDKYIELFGEVEEA